MAEKIIRRAEVSPQKIKVWYLDGTSEVLCRDLGVAPLAAHHLTGLSRGEAKGVFRSALVETLKIEMARMSWASHH